MLLYIEPYAGVSPIIQVIRSATKDINLNVYYLSDHKIINALRSAKEKGINVRVIIDGKPYGINNEKVQKEINSVKNVGVNIKEAPVRFEKHGHNYVFDHAKYVCNNFECEIGTANYSYDAFHRNREYLVVTKNANIVKAANEVFNADWDNTKAGSFAHSVLVLSPGSTSKIVSVISQSGPVEIESEEMGNYQATLKTLEEKGKDLKVILPSSISNEDKKDAEELESHGVQVRLLPKNPIYLHAKMIVGDNKAFIGSENFSYTSLEKNREMGLIINGSSNINKLKNQFNKDWANAQPLTLGSEESSPSNDDNSHDWTHHWHHNWHHNWHHDWHHDWRHD